MSMNPAPRFAVFARPAAVLVVAGASLMALSCGAPPTEEASAPEAAATRPAPAKAAPGEDPHWDYGVEAGPSAWGGLSPKYASCSEGRSQSPIDITGAARVELPALSRNYGVTSLHIVHHDHKADVVNTGHSIQVNYPGADVLGVGGETYPLIQYHFHSPSEHTVNGSHFPMEMHLVHKSDGGGLAVVGVLIEEGGANAAFDPVWANLPGQKGAEAHLEDVKVDVDALLPGSRTTWRYEGSLTTPPCTEGVKWFVMTTPVQLSADQIARFRAILMGNNRPVQPLNGRAVLTDVMGEDSGT